MSLPVSVRLRLWGPDTTLPPYEFTYAPGDGPTFGMGETVVITRTVPETDFWPTQPDPATAQFSLVLPAFPDDVPTLIGGSVALEVFTDLVMVESFYGRVGALTVAPLTLGPSHPGGPNRAAVELIYTCVDYLADLAEVVPDGQFFDDTTASRVGQILGNAEGATCTLYGSRWLTPPIDWPDGGPPGYAGQLNFPTLPESADPMAARLAEVLFVAITNTENDDPFLGDPANVPKVGQFRYVAEPHIIDGLPETFPPFDPDPRPVEGVFDMRPVRNRTETTLATIELLPDGTYGIAPGPGGGGVIIDSCFVARSGTWERRKGKNVTQVVAELDAITAEEVPAGGIPHGQVARPWPTGAPPAGGAVAKVGGLRFTVVNPLTGTDLTKVIRSIGAMYLPAASGPDWGSGELVWHRSADPTGLDVLLPAVGDAVLVAVVNILDEWAPLPGRTWVAGELVSNKFTITGGQVFTTLVLREAPVAGVASGVAVAWNEMPAPAVWANLAPADRWFEYAYATA